MNYSYCEEKLNPQSQTNFHKNFMDNLSVLRVSYMQNLPYIVMKQKQKRFSFTTGLWALTTLAPLLIAKMVVDASKGKNIEIQTKNIRLEYGPILEC